MNRAKIALIRTNQFVRKNKTVISVAATATICVAAHLKTIRNTNDRLVEMGINLNEFYKTEI